MKISFLGAAHEVTGSCTLLETNNKKILVDCGMEQGADIYENCELPVLPAEIDAVFLTHAHIDHSGKIPYLVANGYTGPIYSTEATKSLCEIMLLDSAHIQEFEAEWRNRKAKRSGKELYVPSYTIADAEKSLELFIGFPYNKAFKPFDDIEVEFFDAGHLLGSSSIKFTVTENQKDTSVLFSGDLGNINRPLIRDPQPATNADYVIIESTYGDRLHKERPDYIGQLSEILEDTFNRGGNVIIPSFAIGRTQELLYLFRYIKKKNMIKSCPDFQVYVDSPLAVKATEIYSDDLTDYFDKETLDLLSKGINPIVFDGLNLSVTSEDSKLINLDKKPKVILSASGMCEAGRIRHHLKHNLWRSDSTILFVGYQSEGTIGNKLIKGDKTVKLFGEEITVNAKIEQLDGISGHADKDMMIDWLAHMDTKPKKVFVNHGDDEVCDSFASEITEKLEIEATAPYNSAVYDLERGEYLALGNKVKKQKTGYIKERVNPLFDRLLHAGRRLLSIIEKSSKIPNKELARFTDQINSISDKMER